MSIDSRTLSASDYEKHSNVTMEMLHDQLEALVEEYSPEGANGWECEYSVSTCRKVYIHKYLPFGPKTTDRKDLES